MHQSNKYDIILISSQAITEQGLRYIKILNAPQQEAPIKLTWFLVSKN
ncbi:hypothetical protein VIBNISOn1_1270001 [Vibrio nigripulchritudo SOn1]|uniref:Uncharacterized protein n=1 Tax=Vibrio nigripulchritudo SOn1 TaxID=1238450 RepID=A0AAV2VJP6_9VIBR|nr:hypothetical protein VIBNISOn1_1270001 [Vibrio nigripulchritudo SOn1]